MTTAPDDGTAANAEIVSARDFDAPAARVFGAFTDPEQLQHWWGPNGFTSTITEFDPRPGGAWRLTMRAPDGTEHPIACTFVEVGPARVVYDLHDPVHAFRMTMLFAERAGGTRVTWLMRFADAAEAARVRAFVVPANEQNFDRLAAHLAPK